MFSVIIPNYNHGRFLYKRILSVLNQTFSDFEIIILDDNSNDNSLEILNSFDDPRITHRIYNNENSGSPFKQWKKGLELAKYEYIWIAESDDYCEDSVLEEANKILKQFKDISILYFDTNLIGENEEAYHNTLQKSFQNLHPTLWNNDHLFNGQEYIKKYLSKRNTILNVSSVIFKREEGLNVIDNILEYKTSGDWLFYIYLLESGNVYFSSKKLNYFRHHFQTTRNYNTLEKRQRRLIEKTRILESVINMYPISKKKINKVKFDLIKEWISVHFFKEIFNKSFYKITEIELIKVPKFYLVLLMIKKKIESTLNLIKNIKIAKIK